jgi:hypothetical protein
VSAYYLYDGIPGVWHRWTLAVLAVSRKDADQYINVLHGGGHYVGTVTYGTVKADCGAMTEAADAELKN